MALNRLSSKGIKIVQKQYLLWISCKYESELEPPVVFFLIHENLKFVTESQQKQ